MPLLCIHLKVSNSGQGAHISEAVGPTSPIIIFPPLAAQFMYQLKLQLYIDISLIVKIHI